MYDLNKFANGELRKQFEKGMDAIIENILSADTSNTEKRGLTINIVLKPREDSRIVDASVEIKTKLAALKVAETNIVMDRIGSKAVSKELIGVNENQQFWDGGRITDPVRELEEEYEDEEV